MGYLGGEIKMDVSVKRPIQRQLDPVVYKVDSAIPRMNCYSADNPLVFVNTYPLDNDLTGE